MRTDYFLCNYLYYMPHILAGFERCWSDNWGSSHNNVDNCSVIELRFIIIMFNNFVYELGRNAQLFLINEYIYMYTL